MHEIDFCVFFGFSVNDLKFILLIQQLPSKFCCGLIVSHLHWKGICCRQKQVTLLWG